MTAVEVDGRRFGVRAGWNRLDVGLRGVRVAARADRARASGRRRSSRTRAASASCGSPACGVREALRPPVLAERALAGRDLSRTGLSYVFERTTGDDPFRRDPRPRQRRRRGSCATALDGETRARAR